MKTNFPKIKAFLIGSLLVLLVVFSEEKYQYLFLISLLLINLHLRPFNKGAIHLDIDPATKILNMSKQNIPKN